MDDLISRQAALDSLGERPIVWEDCDEYYLGRRNQYDSDKLAIETLPTIEPKKGKWITKKDACGIGYQICSNCETEIQWRDRHGVILRVDMQNAPFCPNCGADMRGGEDEHTD